MNPAIQSVIAQIPAWRQARSITVEPRKGGLTNANYLLTVVGKLLFHAGAKGLLARMLFW